MTIELTMKCDCLGRGVMNKFTGSAHLNEEKHFSTFKFCGTLSLQKLHFFFPGLELFIAEISASAQT